MTGSLTNFREELQAAVVQPAGPEDQPEPLHGGGGGAPPRVTPRPRQPLGRHRQALPGPHRQRRQEPLACDHGASLQGADEAVVQQAGRHRRRIRERRYQSYGRRRRREAQTSSS
jgi:hypothetical protein